MIRATDLAHRLIRRTVKPGDRVVDATVGNGHDTLFLADLVGTSGRVFGFDVQEAALKAATVRVGTRPQVTFFHAGHEKLAEYLPKAGPDGGEIRLAAAMFNLGYLPGGSKEIVTHAETTIAGLEQVLPLIQRNGIVTLVLYPGHPGGAEEAEEVRSYVENLGGDFAVRRRVPSGVVRAGPELLAIERMI